MSLDCEDAKRVSEAGRPQAEPGPVETYVWEVLARAALDSAMASAKDGNMPAAEGKAEFAIAWMKRAGSDCEGDIFYA